MDMYQHEMVASGRGKLCAGLPVEIYMLAGTLYDQTFDLPRDKPYPSTILYGLEQLERFAYAILQDSWARQRAKEKDAAKVDWNSLDEVSTFNLGMRLVTEDMFGYHSGQANSIYSFIKNYFVLSKLHPDFANPRFNDEVRAAIASNPPPAPKKGFWESLFG